VQAGKEQMRPLAAIPDDAEFTKAFMAAMEGGFRLQVASGIFGKPDAPPVVDADLTAAMGGSKVYTFEWPGVDTSRAVVYFHVRPGPVARRGRAGGGQGRAFAGFFL
jgi:hypothetical protein